jgi:hypothetical protein
MRACRSDRGAREKTFFARSETVTRIKAAADSARRANAVAFLASPELGQHHGPLPAGRRRHLVRD